MDSKPARNLYKVLNKDKETIWVIADSPTQAIDIACIPRPEDEAHVKANEAVAVFAQEASKNKELQAMLDSGEIGEVIFDPTPTIHNTTSWAWKAPFYVLEFKYHGPFNSNVAAANFAINSGLPETARVLRMDR